jgi:protein-tyrosine phosphatase
LGREASILLVCTGNICRSPTMEAVGRARARELGLSLRLDSAGTSGWHEGEPPDPRTVRVGEAAGFSLAALRARKVRLPDFDDFDLILAADKGHLEQLAGLAPGVHRGKLRLFLGGGRDLPDPYYGDDEGFEEVLRLVVGRWARWQGGLDEF